MKLGAAGVPLGKMENDGLQIQVGWWGWQDGMEVGRVADQVGEEGRFDSTSVQCIQDPFPNSFPDSDPHELAPGIFLT